MEQSAYGISWWASWDNPCAGSPPAHDVFSYDHRPTHAQLLATARKQGLIVVRDIDIKDPGNTNALARRLQDPDTTGLGDGYVLSFSDDDATRGAHPLDALLHAVQTAPPAK